nr:glucose-6-phosphate dehydrogenase [Planctomycetota bacterium]
MWYIKPTVSKQDIICAEIPAKPAGIAAFGASGDLVQRKLVPGLFELHKRGLLSENFFFLGCGRKNYTDDDFRQIISKSIKKISSYKDKTWNFINKFYFVSGGYDDPVFYEKLNTRISELNSQYNTQQNIIFYLAVPPHLYTTIVEKLGQQKLSCPQDNASKENVKLVVEKPFGRDLQTAIELDDRIHNCFDEKQIYRIDHYLGKETVQNILVLRFANSIFEPLWNRNFIDHIQITAAESIGIGHRGGYYDNAGALRDMFQNHMLQMLALAAMEPPTSFDADRIRDEKVKLLRSIRPFDIDQLDKFIVKGQYTKATINNHSIPDYRSQNNVDPESTTETFVAAKLLIDNWRWKGVPFYLRTAKALKA